MRMVDLGVGDVDQRHGHVIGGEEAIPMLDRVVMYLEIIYFYLSSSRIRLRCKRSRIAYIDDLIIYQANERPTHCA